MAKVNILADFFEWVTLNEVYLIFTACLQKMKGNDKQKTKGCFLHIAWCDLLNECQAEKNVRLELQDFCYWHTDEHFLPPLILSSQ